MYILVLIPCLLEHRRQVKVQVHYSILTPNTKKFPINHSVGCVIIVIAHFHINYAILSLSTYLSIYKHCKISTNSVGFTTGFTNKNPLSLCADIKILIDSCHNAVYFPHIGNLPSHKNCQLIKVPPLIISYARLVCFLQQIV